MTGAPRFSRAEAERRLGPVVVEAIRRQVDAAPLMGAEQRERLRAVFASARVVRPQAPAAKAA